MIKKAMKNETRPLGETEPSPTAFVVAEELRIRLPQRW